jgi:(p)ppGpp synthase/HD superfamily hydrolase
MWPSTPTKDIRRKSGEPYIYHPIAVARVVASEMGLGTTSIVCAPCCTTQSKTRT